MQKLADTFPLAEAKMSAILTTRLPFAIRDYNTNLAPTNQTIPENVDVIVGPPAGQYIDTQMQNQPVVNVFMRTSSTTYFDGVDQYGLTATYSVVAVFQDSSRGLASSWHIARWIACTAVDVLNTYGADSPGDDNGFCVRLDPTTLSSHSFGNNLTGAVAEYQFTCDFRSAYGYDPVAARTEFQTYATRQQWITSTVEFDPAGTPQTFSVLPTQGIEINAPEIVNVGFTVTPTTGVANTVSAAWTPGYFGYLAAQTTATGFSYGFEELETIWDDPETNELPVHFFIEDRVQQRRTYFSVIFRKVTP